jgi:hypothetical protein
MNDYDRGNIKLASVVRRLLAIESFAVGLVVGRRVPYYRSGSKTIAW